MKVDTKEWKPVKESELTPDAAGGKLVLPPRWETAVR